MPHRTTQQIAEEKCQRLAEFLVTELRVNRPPESPADPDEKKTAIRLSGKNSHYNVIVSRGGREIRAFIFCSSAVIGLPPTYTIEVNPGYTEHRVVTRSSKFTHDRPEQLAVGNIARLMLTRLLALTSTETKAAA